MSRHSDITQSDRAEACSAVIVDHEAVAAAKSGLPSEAVIARTAAIFSALADPTRLRILQALARRELCVCDLSAIAGISQSGVSHQLRLLRDRGLVAFSRDGQRAVYRLADEHVRQLLAQGLEHAREAEGS